MSERGQQVVDAEIVCGAIVLIESPYRNGDRERNLRYLAWCEYDSVRRGEVPIASHGNCTAYWPEDDEHRPMGSAWRDAVRKICSHVAYYGDLGMSAGQAAAEARDSKEGVQAFRRMLPMDMKREFDAGNSPPGSMKRVPADSMRPFHFYSTIFGG